MTRRDQPAWISPSGQSFSIDLIEAAAKARQFSLKKPCAASSAEIACSDMRPPLGFRRCRRSAGTLQVRGIFENAKGFAAFAPLCELRRHVWYDTKVRKTGA
jgi:hypothetical protein